MEYIVAKGFFYGKKKAKYHVGEVLEETGLYKDRLDYFVKIGMLKKRALVVEVEAVVKDVPKPKKSKKSAKEASIL